MTEAEKHTPADWLRDYAHDLMEDGNLDQEAARLEWAAAAFEAQERLIETLTKALQRAERKLTAYVGVCKDDKELTAVVLMVRTALAARSVARKEKP